MKRINRRPSAKKLGKDIATLDALKVIKGYQPFDSAHSPENVQQLYENMVKLQTAETQAEGALKSARDNAADAEWDFHNTVLMCKDSVRGQFGKNSNELQTLGLKKATEFKKPQKKAERDAKKQAA